MLQAYAGQDIAALVISQPNFFGVLEEVDALTDWAHELLEAMQGFAALYDSLQPQSGHIAALSEQQAAVREPDLTPSARILAGMRQHGEGHFRFAQRMARQHQEYFMNLAPDPEGFAMLDEAMEKSLAGKQALEASDNQTFDEFLAFMSQPVDPSDSLPEKLLKHVRVLSGADVLDDEYLAANPDQALTLEGHADERGSREYNIALGERRADAVKRLMVAEGAAPSQLSTVSYGEERPASLGLGEEAMSLNRRVEILY